MGSLSHLLKESWTVVEGEQEKLAGYFYARIFLSNPHLRDLFPVQMEVQRPGCWTRSSRPRRRWTSRSGWTTI